MDEVTVLIEACNEERNIGPCVQAGRLLTPHVLVVDLKSTDETAERAFAAGAEVLPFTHRPLYVELAREFGIRAVKTPWVMILDADERMTPELAGEIRTAVLSPDHSHYQVPRKNIFGGKQWLRHGGWWPDYQTRLIKTGEFETWPTNIHATPHVRGKRGRLNHAFLHLFHGNVEEMVKKTAVFEDIESDLLFKAGRGVKTSTFFRKFFGELWRRLFARQAFRDGTVGILEAVYQAFSKTITYLFLYEKKNSRTS